MIPEEFERMVIAGAPFIESRIFTHHSLNRLGGLRQVVVWDLGEKEMMRHMSCENDQYYASLVKIVTISYVVQRLVNTETVITVDGLWLSSDEAPVSFLIHLDFLVLVLQVSDHHHPEALKQKWDIIIFDERQHAVVAKHKSSLKSVFSVNF